MVSSKLKLPLTAAALLAVASWGMTTTTFAKSNTGAIVGGIIAGAAVGAVVSSAINQPRIVYVPAPPPPQPWPQTYSPKPGVNCYPAQRACYNASGAYNANWTYRVYAK